MTSRRLIVVHCFKSDTWFTVHVIKGGQMSPLHKNILKQQALYYFFFWEKKEAMFSALVILQNTYYCALITGPLVIYHNQMCGVPTSKAPSWGEGANPWVVQKPSWRRCSHYHYGLEGSSTRDSNLRGAWECSCCLGPSVLSGLPVSELHSANAA